MFCKVRLIESSAFNRLSFHLFLASGQTLNSVESTPAAIGLELALMISYATSKCGNLLISWICHEDRPMHNEINDEPTKPTRKNSQLKKNRRQQRVKRLNV